MCRYKTVTDAVTTKMKIPEEVTLTHHPAPPILLHQLTFAPIILHHEGIGGSPIRVRVRVRVRVRIL